MRDGKQQGQGADEGRPARSFSLRGLRQPGRIFADVKLPPLWRDRDVESVTCIAGVWLAVSRTGDEGWTAKVSPPSGTHANQVIGDTITRHGRRATRAPLVVTAVAAERHGGRWRWVIDVAEQAPP